MKTSENSIQKALEDYDLGVVKSGRAASRAYAVPNTTLQGRMKGALPHAIAHSAQQRLTPEQEEYLVNWILEQDSFAQPPSHKRAREMAARILKAGGDERPLGRRWLTGFLRRQPRVASVVGRTIEVARADAAKPEQIQAWLDLYIGVRTAYKIEPKNIYNMDETGVALGICDNNQVLARSGKKKAYKKEPGNREWVSIIETVSATGCKLRPMVIFKGKHVQVQWFDPDFVPNWEYHSSQNGWTSKDAGMKWLDRIFLPETKLETEGYRLLILDGHLSHVDIDFMWAAKQAKVICLYLPAHTSHILQPLDLVGFNILKSRYRAEIQDLATLDDAAPVKKQRFIACYHNARRDGLTSATILSGWKATGLQPYRPKIPVQSSQLSARPITPPKASQPIQIGDLPFRTPQKPQDIQQATQALRDAEFDPRSTRLILQKAAKAIAKGNIAAAELQAENQRLKRQLEAVTGPSTKRRAHVDPNERFFNAEKIIAAIEREAVKPQKTPAEEAEKAAAKVAAEIEKKTIQDMTFEWQLE